MVVCPDARQVSAKDITQDIATGFDREAFFRGAVDTASYDDVSAMRALPVDTVDEAGYVPDVDEVGSVLASRYDEDDGHIWYALEHGPAADPLRTRRWYGAAEHMTRKVRWRHLCRRFSSVSIDLGQLTLAVSLGEETSQFGGVQLGGTLSQDGVIIRDPTGPDVCVAAKGSFGGHVTVIGESAHSSKPGSARNLLRVAGAVVDALGGFDVEYGPGTNEELGEPSLTPTRIASGGPLNQIPAECTVSFDRRFVPWIPSTMSFFVSGVGER